jgi:threonine dehydrogenase-like Zn-dependent dehydrogenase
VLTGASTTTPWSSANALRVIASGRYPVAKLHSHSFGLDEVERALLTLGNQIEGEQPLHITIKP